MSKIRVHELAKELNKSSKDVIYALKGHGVVVESHMSTISDESAGKIRKFFTAPPVKKEEAPKAAAPERQPVRPQSPAGNEQRPAGNSAPQNRQSQGQNGERRPYNNNYQGQNRQGQNGERRPYNNNYQGQNRQGQGQGQNGERRPYNNNYQGQNRQG
ncbi:MAG: translation initiation factor IF-2, partial [Clostridia bacterium]|nr:translation initiation factor IF-2 [Clostridia bacterium]